MTAQNEDILPIIQAKFLSTEIVKCIHRNVSLVEGPWNNLHRIFALVECFDSFALFVLVSDKKQPQGISDLRIERAIPINQYFSCDTEVIPDNQSHLIFNIHFKDITHKFRIEIGFDSSKFASEVIRSKEFSNNKTDTDTAWCDKYSNLFVGNMYNESNSQPTPTTSNTRESLVKYQLKLKEQDYTKKEEFTIFCGTWNVNGRPPSEKLDEWLKCDDKPPDIYAVGFQEIDLSKEAFIFNDTPREKEWLDRVLATLNGEKNKYRYVALVRLVGIQLMVFVKNDHYSNISNVSVDTVGTGILGKMGNKGGVAVRFSLHSTYLCFVCAHFAAHMEQMQRRNQDFEDIYTRINFKKHPPLIKDHDQIYWIGDLNYRINDLSSSEVQKYLRNDDLDTLLKKDQLNDQRLKSAVFKGFQEGDITFKPTYKFDLYTDTYDTSEKSRVPAWTDRILWKGKSPRHDILQLRYNSHMELKASDHKPVSSFFVAEISVIDQEKYKEIHEDLLRKMDKQENEYLPQVTIDKHEIKFDLVKFEEPCVQELIIANTGVVPADFEFIKKLKDETYCKEWLKITPYADSINPGEKRDVKLEINLKTNLDKLEDILVLHLRGGKDMFITISGTAQRSCFLMSISELCRCPVPIMRLTEDQWKLIRNPESPILYCIPRELFFLIDHLYRYGLKTKELFESTTNEELIKIRDWLDFGSLEPLPKNLQAVAESLLLFLFHTQDPVIPYELQDSCIAAASNFHTCQQIITHKLPDLHRNVFLYICMFLQELLRYSNENRYDAKTLSLIFGDAILRDKILVSKPQASRGKSNFIYNFLMNDLSSAIIPNK